MTTAAYVWHRQQQDILCYNCTVWKAFINATHRSYIVWVYSIPRYNVFLPSQAQCFCTDIVVLQPSAMKGQFELTAVIAILTPTVLNSQDTADTHREGPLVPFRVGRFDIINVVLAAPTSSSIQSYKTSMLTFHNMLNIWSMLMDGKECHGRKPTLYVEEISWIKVQPTASLTCTC